MFANIKFLSILWLCAGIGVGGHYGVKVYELPAWNEAEIEQSVELNLAIDLQRMGPHLQPDTDKLLQLRQLIRREIEADIHSQQREAWRGLIAGVALILVGLVPLLLQRRRGA